MDYCVFYQLFGFILTAPIHCRGIPAEFIQISSDEKTHLHLGWPEGEHNFKLER